MKKWIQVSLVFFLGFSVGLFFSPHFKTPHQSESEFNKENSLRADSVLRKKIQELYDVDFEEYHKLKSLKAKYLKANDLLGKMMTLFLAELGLRMNSKNIADTIGEAQNLAQDIDDNLSSTESNCKMKEKKCPTLKELAENFVDKNQSKKSKEKIWVKNEEKLAFVGTDQEIEDFLKNVEIPDFFYEVTTSKMLTDERLQSIQGIFDGVLKYDHPEKADAEIYMELDGVLEKGKIVGELKIELRRDGKAFSSSNGDGDLKSFRQIPGSKNAILLSMGTGYFQLYPLGPKKFVGNYYFKKDLTVFEKLGTVKIFRR